ncbi:hypothetical protein D0868_14693 [Hortaea werneckii]|uniref:Uncharacterized protein n=1 Tax=Hortaea werneckii TaxID=91943 RepID=A0A3M6XEL1_HORWE|nr:hypothetical protein D0868_14693 [Hortaea werneckii]
MINGVLVERTVNEVLPALQTNAEGLKKVLEDLVKQYRAKQEDMDKWKATGSYIWGSFLYNLAQKDTYKHSVELGTLFARSNVPTISDAAESIRKTSSLGKSL